MVRLYYLPDIVFTIISISILLFIVSGLYLEFRYHRDVVLIREVDEVIKHTNRDLRTFGFSRTRSVSDIKIWAVSTKLKLNSFPELFTSMTRGISKQFRYLSQWCWHESLSVSNIRVLFLCLCLTIIIILAVRTFTHVSYNPLFVAIASILWFDPLVNKTFRTFLFILPSFFGMVGLLTVIVLCLAAFSNIMFELNRYENNEYYYSYEESLWSIFVAITSSSYPNQLLPSYQERRNSILFFFVAVVIGSFIFLSLILLVVFSEFKRVGKMFEEVEKTFRQINLKLAFEILDQKGQGYLSYLELDSLLKELYNNFDSFRVPSNSTDIKRRILVAIMDVSNASHIKSEEFNLIVDISHINLQKVSNINYTSNVDMNTMMSRLFRLLFQVAKSPLLRILVDVSVLICVCILITEGNTVYSMNPSTSREVLFCLFGIISLEITIKGVTLGERYFNNASNKTECVVAIILAVLLFFDILGVKGHSYDLLKVARATTIIRLFFALRSIDILFPNLKLANIVSKTYDVCDAPRPILEYYVVFYIGCG